MCSIPPWDKWCLGWKLHWQWLSSTFYLEVRVPAQPERAVYAAIKSCLEDEAVRRATTALLAAISHDGVGLVAAKEDFVAAFEASMRGRRSDVSTIELRQSCGWGDADEAPKLIGA